MTVTKDWKEFCTMLDQRKVSSFSRELIVARNLITWCSTKLCMVIDVFTMQAYKELIKY